MNIGHVAIYVKDLEESARFFETYFQGRRNELYVNPNTGFSSYFLSFDDSTRLELMNIPVISEPNGDPQLGYAHIAFQVGSKDEVDRLTARLEKDGYVVKSYPRTTGDGYYESSIYDVILSENIGSSKIVVLFGSYCFPYGGSERLRKILMGL